MAPCVSERKQFQNPALRLHQPYSIKTKTTMNTFFDSLMISDSERIHTQTLAWILKLDGSSFPTFQKTEFLKRLFGIAQLEVADNIQIYVETEVNSIDLFVDCEGHQFIIENKLKSSEHSEQTKKYIQAIPLNFNYSKSRNFGFLTLIKERATNQEWLNISFEDLLRELDSVEWGKDTREYIFVEEYLKTLSNLVKVFNDFKANHENYSNVFNDGYKKKHDKKNYSYEPYQDYVRTNQLETIFQKAFIKQIAEDIELPEHYVTETRGTALIQIYLKEFSIKNEPFKLGLQFQGTTFKINLSHLKYDASRANQVDPELIMAFKETFYEQNDYKRLNKPRSKAYLSVSKSTGKPLYMMSKKEIKASLKDEVDFLRNKIPEFERKIKTLYNNE